MNKKKQRILMNAFITFQFSYCALVWMHHSRIMNNRINKIHEKPLRLVYKDEANLYFNDLLKKEKSVGIHQRNLHLKSTILYISLGTETIQSEK